MGLSKAMRLKALDKTPPGVLEKLAFYRKALIALFFKVPFIFIRAIFRDKKKTRSYLHELRNGILRAALAGMSAREMVSMAPTTPQTLKTNCKKLGLTLETEYLNHDCQLHWVGDRKAEKVIVYSHGGGFGYPTMDGHVIFLHKCVKYLEKKGIKAVIAFVDYGLTPRTRYPETFKQVLECFNHVLELGYKPSDIIIGGDSAGGNASLAILSHLTHPHPSIPKVSLPPNTKLAGALLICPWVGLVPTCPSATSNLKKDVIFIPHLECWRAMFVDDDKLDNYSQPLEAPVKWWKGIPVEKVLVVGGGDEILIDDVVEIGKKIREATEEDGTETDIVVAEKEVHIDCVFDAQTGMGHGVMARTCWEWLEKVWA